jgi:hypothetical protein
MLLSQLDFEVIIPGQAGIHCSIVDSRLPGNDTRPLFSALTKHYTGCTKDSDLTS